MKKSQWKLWTLIAIAVFLLTACKSEVSSIDKNDTQSEKMAKEAETEAVAKTEVLKDSETSDEPGVSGIEFESVLGGSAMADNYYYELVMDNMGQTVSMKYWAIGRSYKTETMGMITFVNEETGKMGIYTEETNSVMLMDYQDTGEMINPFTYIASLDKSTFSQIRYKGEETLDDKEVLVFEYSGPEFSATYYVWKEYGLIIKMESKVGDVKTMFYFKDLAFGRVKEEDITYPEDAQVTDLSN
ncbi:MULTISPECIES: hypothetical protein [unclassified Fusibacter]|uniref:hypothetical protein n=1 Tax=unclassified Fusibacter TaxID=2624464 RepID=UPI001012DE72|nr:MULTISPECIES: hypothetical protein [unclassified Fusibacter]MCK8060170.1 hypothetical protein [Fusibacter sp. A2]NPE22310.1 hypothetical protein [Fusibacter sp. A1]RXV61083.1 hypothetical protein DWB64_10725 [Fusibacter sp. A1]